MLPAISERWLLNRLLGACCEACLGIKRHHQPDTSWLAAREVIFNYPVPMMPLVPSDNPESEKLVGELLSRASAVNEKYGIRLTAYAEVLLRLTAEAWINDPPMPSMGVYAGADVEVEAEAPPFDRYEPQQAIDEFGREDWLAMALDTYEASLQDERVQILVEHHAPVSFPVLFHVLADAGDRRMATWGWK